MLFFIIPRGRFGLGKLGLGWAIWRKILYYKKKKKAVVLNFSLLAENDILLIRGRSIVLHVLTVLAKFRSFTSRYIWKLWNIAIDEHCVLISASSRATKDFIQPFFLAVLLMTYEQALMCTIGELPSKVLMPSLTSTDVSKQTSPQTKRSDQIRQPINAGFIYLSFI